MQKTRLKGGPILPEDYLSPEDLDRTLRRGDCQDVYNQFKLEDPDKAERYAVICYRLDRMAERKGSDPSAYDAEFNEDAIALQHNEPEEIEHGPPEGYEALIEYLEDAIAENRLVGRGEAAEAVGWPSSKYRNARVRGLEWAKAIEHLYQQVALPQQRSSDAEKLEQILRDAIASRSKVRYVDLSEAIGRAPATVRNAVRLRSQWIQPLLPLLREAGLKVPE